MKGPPPVTANARLLSLSVASPPFILPQEEVIAGAREAFGERYREFDRLKAVFTTAGIRTRQSVRPMQWYAQPLGWPERTEAYLEGADALFAEAAQSALHAAGLSGRDVDTVVTVSSTGIATPSLEARAMGRLGFRSDIKRVPVFGLGCAGGVSGLSLAARLACADPGSKVLFVTVELCTLSFRLDALTKANIVATALFGDGAAAAVLSTEGAGAAQVIGAAETSWPDTLDIMGWRVDPTGFGVIFAQSIPVFAQAELGRAMASLLEDMGVERSSVERFVCHPGGAKVITALESALELETGALDHERAVLADHGNMSAPTVLFVLDRLLRSGLPSRVVLTALGPGFTASALALERLG